MPSDFDKVFAEAQAQRLARAQAAEQHRLAEERRLENERQLVRSIAEPYLRDVGIHASRRLLELGVPLEWKSWTGDVKRLFWGSRQGVIQSEALWVLYSPYSGPFLTRDGYFIKDYKLPGEQGFDAFLNEMPLYAPDADGSFPQGGVVGNGEVYVDARTREVRIGIHNSLGDEMGYERLIYQFGEWVANRILTLADNIT